MKNKIYLTENIGVIYLNYLWCKPLFKQKIFYTTVENNARNTQADLISIFTTYGLFAANKRDALLEENLVNFGESRSL